MVWCVFFCCVCLVGCENETKLRVAHISDNTAARDTNYSIKVVLDDDDRVKEKYVDLQLKSSEEGQRILFCEDRKDQTYLFLERNDYWYNLTYLLNQANGVNANGQYLAYKDYGGKAYNFSVPNDVKLTFRVVAGNIQEDEKSGEKILVLSEDISQEVEINAKKSS